MTEPAGGVMVEERTETARTDTGDHDVVAHYYDKRRFDVTRAMVEGLPIVALCGKKWIPSRDAAKHPVCPDCKDILDSIHPPEGGA